MHLLMHSRFKVLMHAQSNETATGREMKPSRATPQTAAVVVLTHADVVRKSYAVQCGLGRYRARVVLLFLL